MKNIFIFALVTSALAAPLFAFGQSNGTVTRAQVRAELVELEKAGYNPSGDANNYPQDIQEAEQKVWEQQGVAMSSYGSSTAGTSATGGPAHSPASGVMKSFYFGH